MEPDLAWKPPSCKGSWRWRLCFYQKGQPPCVLAMAALEEAVVRTCTAMVARPLTAAEVAARKVQARGGVYWWEAKTIRGAA